MPDPLFNDAGHAFQHTLFRFGRTACEPTGEKWWPAGQQDAESATRFDVYYVIDMTSQGQKLMDKQEITLEQLEQLAAALAAAIPDVECPEQCECGCVYQYMEVSAAFYREEWEWACLAHALVRYRAVSASRNKSSG
jgi:hypothetical protein